MGVFWYHHGVKRERNGMRDVNIMKSYTASEVSVLVSEVVAYWLAYGCTKGFP